MKEQTKPSLSSEKTRQTKTLLLLKNEICSNNMPTHSSMAASQLINQANSNPSTRNAERGTTFNSVDSIHPTIYRGVKIPYV